MTIKHSTGTWWLWIALIISPFTAAFGQQDLFILNQVTNQNPYKGEVIVLTQKLYTRLAINNIGRIKHPSFNGFWTENLDIGNYEIIQEQYEGKLYNTLILSRTILIPQRSGRMVIDPSAVMIQRVTERTVNRPLFGGVIQQRVRDFSEHEIKSSTLILEVKELPERNKPASFRGTVGTFTFSAQLSAETTEVGEPIELSLSISGAGNLKLIDKPQLQLPPGLELFEPEVSGTISVSAAGMSGKRIYKYLLIPRDTGSYTLQGIEFSHFNPESGIYQLLQSPPLTLYATQGKEKQGYRTANMGKEDVRYYSKDIRFIRLNYRMPWIPGFIPGSWWHLIMLLAPLILLILWIIRYRKRVKMYADKDKMRYTKAQQIALQRIREAATAMKQQDDTIFYQLLLDALWGYAADKLNLKPADLTRGHLAEVFANKGIGQDLIKRFIAVIDECEFSRYSPISQPLQMGKIHQEVKSLIDLMDG
jgi:hypothetical protein